MKANLARFTVALSLLATMALSLGAGTEVALTGCTPVGAADGAAPRTASTRPKAAICARKPSSVRVASDPTARLIRAAFGSLLRVSGPAARPPARRAREKVCYARPMTAAAPRTIVDKIWTDHVVTQDPGAPAVLAVDLHLVHEVTSPQAFSGLRARGIGVRRPGQTVATADHSIPTTDRSLPFLDAMALAQVNQLEANCAEFGIPLHGIGDPAQGIVHVIGPQLGLTQPGMTIVCGDSHTSTHGAFGALAFGIGTSEVEMVLATQTLLQRDPKTYEVRVDGRLTPGVSAKDIILVAHRPDRHRRRDRPRLRVHRRGDPRPDHGTADDRLQHEHRRRRAGRADRPGRHDLRVPPRPAARAGRRRPGTPRSSAGARLPTDDGATYDKTITIDADALEPMVTYGTNPGMGIPITSRVPSPGRPGRPGPAPRPRAGARVHGPPARPGDPRPEGRCRLRRELHERPDQRPAAGRQRAQGPPRRRRRPPDGRARARTR